MLNCGGRHLTYVAGNRTVSNGARFRGSSLLGRFDALIRMRLTVFRGEQDKSGVQSPDLSRGETGALAGEAVHTPSPIAIKAGAKANRVVLRI